MRTSKPITGLALLAIIPAAIGALATFGLGEPSTESLVAFAVVALLVLAASGAVARSRWRLDTPYW